MKSCLILLALVSISSSVILDCNFKNQTWVLTEISYPCYGKILSTGNDAVLEGVEGTHLSGKSLIDVQGLQVWDYETRIVRRILRDIKNIFPNLKGMDWVAPNLTSIAAEDLRPFPNLLVFGIQYSQVISIADDFFKFTPNLHKVWFEVGAIEHVGYDLLTNLDKLLQLSFLQNPCIDEWAPWPDTVPDVIEAVRRKCPPLEECSAGCSVKIDGLEKKIIELNAKHESDVSELNDGLRVLSEIVTSYEDRIVELERMIREMDWIYVLIMVVTEQS